MEKLQKMKIYHKRLPSGPTQDVIFPITFWPTHNGLGTIKGHEFSLLDPGKVMEFKDSEGAQTLCVMYTTLISSLLDAASFLRLSKNGKLSWIWRRRSMTSTNAVLSWRWWPTRPWWIDTGIASPPSLGIHLMWNLTGSCSGTSWWHLCWRIRKILRYGGLI